MKLSRICALLFCVGLLGVVIYNYMQNPPTLLMDKPALPLESQEESAEQDAQEAVANADLMPEEQKEDVQATAQNEPAQEESDEESFVDGKEVGQEQSAKPETSSEKNGVEEDGTKIEEPQGPVELEGVDTVDIQEGGNWLIKRQALENTVDMIEMINKVFTSVLELRMDYQLKRNTIDNEYDNFIGQIGFDLGDLSKTLEVLLESMEQERTKQGDLTQEEREFVTLVQEKKEELQNLLEMGKNLEAFDTKINDVIITVEKQIDTANDYRTQSWRNFQEIKKVLSDQRAEELYFSTQSLYKNIQEIYGYLQGELARYFEQQIQTMRTTMNTIKSSLQDLQSLGIDLQKEAKKLQQDEEVSKPAPVEQKPEKIAKPNIFKDIMTWPFRKVGQFFGWLWGLIGFLFGGKK